MLQRNVGDWVVVRKKSSYFNGYIGVIHAKREADSLRPEGYFITLFAESGKGWYQEDTTFKEEAEIADIGSRPHPNVVPIAGLVDDYLSYINVDRDHIEVGCQRIPYARVKQMVELLDRTVPGWRDVPEQKDPEAGVQAPQQMPF